MAFLKYAKAAVVKPLITLDGWNGLHVASGGGHPYREAAQAPSRVVLQEYDPSKFLLTHCTIIASVDTEQGTDPLGRQLVDGFQIDRRYADWLVTPETSKYINNNNDCWERKLLLAAFRTFVGGENYVEHIQIPELSKGKIIDAASRDIGDSIYVDILVATDRKHRPLIEAITSGRLQTLSMGCQVAHTTCTKCGNVAEDEAQLCPHIRYMKGNEWFDALGKKRKVAELCGHITAEPGSVKFIEASWVANPAFTGAVLRSILSPLQGGPGLGERLQVAFSEPTRTADPSLLQKAARQVSPTHFRTVMSEDFDFSPSDQGGGGQAPAEGAKPEEKKDPLESVVNELADALRERAIARVRKDMAEGESADRLHNTSENQNEDLIKSAMQHPEWRTIARMVLRMTPGPSAARRMLAGLIRFKAGGWMSVRKATDLSRREMLALSRIIDKLARKQAMAGEGRVYRAVVATGGPSMYPDTATYVEACARVMGRAPNQHEIKALVVKGRIYECGH